MPNVKRTFTLPDDVSAQLDEAIPKFIVYTYWYTF